MEEDPVGGKWGLVQECCRRVGACPIFLLLIDWRYGDRQKDLSLTHHEFRRAQELEHYCIVLETPDGENHAKVDDSIGLKSIRHEALQCAPAYFKRSKMSDFDKKLRRALELAERRVDGRGTLYLRTHPAKIQPPSEQLRIRSIMAQAAEDRAAGHDLAYPAYFWIQPMHPVREPFGILPCECLLPLHFAEILDHKFNDGLRNSWYQDEIVFFHKEGEREPDWSCR